jgi:arylsulfatase A-like enzyme
MTGLYPHTAGHRTMFHMLRPHEPHLLTVLKRVGYRIVWAGKNDLVPGQDGVPALVDELIRTGPANLPDGHACDDWRGAPQGDNWYSFLRGLIRPPGGEPLRDHDAQCVAGACAAIRAAPSDRPLCVYVPIGSPHPPYACPEPFFSAIDRAALPPRVPTPADWTGFPALMRGIAAGQNLTGWDEIRWRELRAVYAGMILRVDSFWGELVAALRAAGRYDDALLLAFSDHGDWTGDFGLVEKAQNCFSEGLVRVPLVIKPPAALGAVPGLRSALAELVDVPATIYDLLGIAPGYSHFGRSLLPLCRDPAAGHRDAVFCEGGRRPGEYQCMELESASSCDPHGLYYPRIARQIQDEGPEHGKATMLRTTRWKYIRRLLEQDELYDLAADPGETVNRIADPALAGVLAQLRERLLAWYQETCDTVPQHGDSRNFGHPAPDWRANLPARYRAAECR